MQTMTMRVIVNKKTEKATILRIQKKSPGPKRSSFFNRGYI